MKGLVLVVLAACACPPKKSTGLITDTSAGSGSAAAADNTCEGQRAHVEALYRAEAAAQEPQRATEAVADNTAMVLGECTKAPDKVVPCLQKVTTVKDLEAQCMPALSEEGSEADVLKQ